MRLIDADILADEIESMKISVSGRPATFDEAKSDVMQVIDEQKTVDAIEVVRCKDCKHYKEFRTKRNKQIMRLCCRMGKNDMEYSVKPDDFCSFGERRNEDAAD